jgi:hypothetical protein
MGRHFKKILAPALIIGVIVLYYALMGLLVALDLLPFNLPGAIKAALVVLPLAVIGMGVYVLVERIKEIRSGEEDDLSQY